MRLVFVTVLIFAAHLVSAATWYVDASSQKNSAGGQSPDDAFRTIQSACEVVNPGDSVIVAPGIYPEIIQLKRVGEVDKPITFKAAKNGLNQVIITGADPALRNKEIKWELVDEALQLYGVNFGHKPSRMLYDGVDLMPYPDLQSLKDFRFSNGYPSAKHGFAFEGGKLYVRLHPTKYGSTDPNQHVMAVSPENVCKDGPGMRITKPSDYNFGILLDSPAYVVIDGFTFETPAIAGVFINGSEVTVRNCWFRGCRFGVTGIGISPFPKQTTNRVTVEYCDYSQFPAFDDVKEVILQYKDDPWRGPAEKRNFLQKIYWWFRKGDAKVGIGYNTTYETGIAGQIGADWIVRYNYIHDAWEGLSMWCTDFSRNLKVYGNRFERLIDNAVEAENHAVNLQVYENEMVDVFEAISWQPLDGPPWPGPVYVYRNYFWVTPEHKGIWGEAGWDAAIFKIGADNRNWKDRPRIIPESVIKAEGEGFYAFNNTIDCPDHSLLTRIFQDEKRSFDNFFIFNNIIVLQEVTTRPAIDKYVPVKGNGMSFERNIVVVLNQSNQAEEIAALAGNGGKVLKKTEDIKWQDTAKHQYSLQLWSPARNIGLGDYTKGVSKDAGAVPSGEKWSMHPYGVQPNAK